MNAKDFLEEIDYYNTNVDGEIFEDLGIETLADILEVYHQRKLKLLGIGVVSQQRELLCFCGAKQRTTCGDNRAYRVCENGHEKN